MSECLPCLFLKSVTEGRVPLAGSSCPLLCGNVVPIDTAATESPSFDLPTPPPSIHRLQRLETISNLLSPSTPASSFDFPPTRLFFLATLTCLLPLRILSALYTPIQDCDETYNYWEPTHFLLHGHGMQTWEYSPTYALRSYLYLGLHALAIKVGQWTGAVDLEGGGKVGEFYFLRIVLACVCALCESYFVWAIASRMRRSVAVTTAALLACSAGMFHASIAFIPSSFTMYAVMLSLASWMRSDYPLAVLCTGVSALIGWPFAGLVAVPLALDVGWRYLTRLHLPILWSILTLAVCLIPLRRRGLPLLPSTRRRCVEHRCVQLLHS